MPSVGTASIDLIVDKQQFGRSLTGAVDGGGGIFKSAGAKFAGVFAGGFAALKGADLFKSAVDGASDLAENQSKVNTVFGEMGGAVTQYAKAADAIGLSDNAALEAVGTFGNLFDQMGIGSRESAKMSTSLTDLAADLASFHNADISDVIGAQTAAFRGEYDGLQRFIPTINAAAVEQAALAATGKKTTKELTAQEKAIAVQKLMIEGAGAAMGDFARTSDGLANKQRILSARWEDAKAALGRGLLPAVSAVTGLFAKNIPKAMNWITKFATLFNNTFLRQFSDDPDITSDGFAGQLEKAGMAVRNLWDNTLKPAALWLKDNWQTAIKVAAAAFILFTGPITAVVLTLGILWIRFKVVRDVVGAAVSFIGEQLRNFGAWASQVFPQVREAIMHFVSVVQAAWRLWGDDILRVAKAVWSQIQLVIQTGVDIIKNVIQFVLAIINGDWGKAWDAIKGIFGAALDYIVGTAKNLLGVLSGIFGGALDAAGRIVGLGIDKVVGFFAGLPLRVGKATAGLFDGIKSAFKSAVNWIIEKWNDFHLTIGGGTILGKKLPSITLNTPDLPHFAQGGDVPGPPGAPLLAVLHGGERVQSRRELESLRNSTRAGLVVNVNNAIVGNQHQLGRYLSDVLDDHFENGGARPPWAR